MAVAVGVAGRGEGVRHGVVVGVEALDPVGPPAGEQGGVGPGPGELAVAVVGEAAGVGAVAVVPAVRPAAHQVEAGGAAHPAVVHPGQVVPGVEVVAGAQPVSPGGAQAVGVGAGVGGARHPPAALQRRPGQTQAGLGLVGMQVSIGSICYAFRITFEWKMC